MDKVEVTSMSTRGQVVIPQNIREQLGFSSGEKFMVITADDAIILKRISSPSSEEFAKILKQMTDFAKKNSITKKDVHNAIKRSRA